MRTRFFLIFLFVLLIFNSIHAEENLQLDVMTVTAQKQEENLQDVSSSVTAFSKIDIEDNQISSISDIANFTPNFINFNTGIIGLSVPSIRGIHEDGSGGSPVGLFIDGIPILSVTGFNAEMLDIERVEVMRGPQGSLYGSNTEIGAINVITVQPGNSFMGKASVEIGEDSKRRVMLNVQGPIQKDKLFYSLSAFHHEKDGYIKNSNTGETENNRKYDYFKANLRWTPTDKIDISLIGSQLTHDDGDQDIVLGPFGAEAYGVAAPKNREVNSDLIGWNKSSSNLQALNVKWDIKDHLELQSITAKREYRSYYLNDWDFTTFQLYHKEMDSTLIKYSQEFKVSWTGDKNKLITGIYYDIDDNIFKDKNDVTGIVEEDHTTEGSTLGLFVNNESKLSEKLAVIAGIRFDQTKGKFKDKIRSRKIDETWSETSPKIGFEYDHSDNIMTYAVIAKGYRTGGFNDHAAADDPQTYEQEKLLSYEIGAKTDFFNKRFVFNFNVYYMDIEDIQVRIDNPNSPEYNYTANAAKAQSSGLEIDAKARLTETVTLSSTIGYNHTKFKDYKDSNGDYDGNNNPYSPEYTYSLTLLQRNPDGFFGNISLFGVGEMYLDKENIYKVEPYYIANAKVGYEFKDVDLYIYAKNLFDKEYDTEGYYGGYYTVYSPPREIGVRIDYRF